MKSSEFKKMDKEALSSALGSFHKELSKLNLQRSTGTKLENPGNVRKIRRNIARVYTELQSKKTAERQGGTEKKQ